MNKYILDVVVFICGAAIMIFELIGSRLLAPYLGTSIFIWTSLIGIVLGSLSIGYWLGGIVSDKWPSQKVLACIIFAAAVYVLMISFFNTPIIKYVQSNISDLRISSVISCILLFSIPSILFGIVSPFIVRLKMSSVAKSGETVGNLYAVSTLGSITGTFLAGFYLIAHFGNTTVLIFLATGLVLAGFLTMGGDFFKPKIAFLVILTAASLLLDPVFKMVNSSEIIDINTPYNRVWIYDGKDTNTGRMVRVMQISNEHSSAIFLDNGESALEYSKFYRLDKHFHSDIKKALIIGGGAYTYPNEFIKKFPDAVLHVVEIDPILTKISKKYFGLKENPRMNIYHEDGRTFLNKSEEKYDVVYLDAFKSLYSIPYQLTTIESMQRIYEVLNDDGILLINVISSIEGKKGKFLRAEYRTLKELFPQVYIFGVQEPENGKKAQNILIVAFKSKIVPKFYSRDRDVNKYLQHLWIKEVDEDMPVLTDEYAPVDQYIMQVQP